MTSDRNHNNAFMDLIEILSSIEGDTLKLQFEAVLNAMMKQGVTRL